MEDSAMQLFERLVAAGLDHSAGFLAGKLFTDRSTE
jgi:hypothetical protein